MQRQTLLTAILVLAGSALVALAAYLLYRTPQPPPRAQLPVATFGGVSLNVELATTTAAMERGLGGRTSLPQDQGMLFVFPNSQKWGFWMKDTLIPLDMFWLDAQGRVVYLAQDVATDTYPTVFYPSAPALFVLETNAGFARTHGISTGTPFTLQKPIKISQ